MRELEREAMRIAIEIVGEEPQDLHLAEERGAQFPEHFDIDEERRYSSVFRGVDDSGYDEDRDIFLDSQNSETFGAASSSVFNKPFANLTSGKISVGAQIPSCSSLTEEQQYSKSSTTGDLHRLDSSDKTGYLLSQLLSDSSAINSESRIQENQFYGRRAGSTCVEEFGERMEITEDAQTSKDASDTAGASANYISNPSSSQGSNKVQVNISSPSDWTGNSGTATAQGATLSVKTHGRPGSSASTTSESGHVASALNGPALSPSSSLGSLSSEKSTLNPHAKGSKLNPNAKSFVPSQSPWRPASPVSDGSSYFPPNVPSLPHMRMPVGIGVGPSYSTQPVIYNTQVLPMQTPQGYFHPNGPQYGQQMIFGHPQQLVYMPTYSPKMQYRGRDF